MPKPRTVNKVDPLATLPAWAKKLAERYYTKTVSTFLVYGAVRDLQPAVGTDGNPAYVDLRSFFADELFGSRDLVLFYDRSSGIRGASPEVQKDLSRGIAGYDALYGTDFARSMPRDPGRALQLLENYLRMRLADGRSLALVVDFAETLAPNSDVAQLSSEDRFALTTLEKWSHDPQFLAGNLSIVLVAENLADVTARLSRNPYVSLIEIPLPDEEQRFEYVRYKLSGRQIDSISDVPLAGLAKLTAGLSRIHLDRVLTEAIERQVRITNELIKDRKKEILQAECHGLLEFIEPSHNLDSVAGQEKAKKRLRDAAAALRKGQIDVMPMGYLISGAVGTGKTFLASCFAGEIGIPCVKFLNFRSQWQGVTEANLERIFNLLKALWPVAVMIDEADAFLGNREASGDSGTSNRVFAAIASFMGNTEYRGKIIWFLLTCRPDLLPIDLKRQGRAEEHLALFYPETNEERDQLFKVISKKNNLQLALPSFSALLGESARGLSGADIEAILVRSKFRALSEGRDVTPEDVQFVVKDFVPPSYPLEVELQNLAAVRECTSRELLPERFRNLDQETITRRIGELKLMLEQH
jgi:SpoVK/Ycf46/Vps4 family AAA+-type ATPase